MQKYIWSLNSDQSAPSMLSTVYILYIHLSDWALPDILQILMSVT